MSSDGQAEHLKAYGIAFAAMKEGIAVDWLLNYEGGSFGMENDGDIADMCKQRGVTYELISDAAYARIVKKISAPSFNGKVVKLDQPPKIAVYTPLNKEPWDDAVTLALTYAGIPFDKIYADQVLAGDLGKYDWLHLHHEDFTGQYSKFWANYQGAGWYQADVATMQAIATRNGFSKVSQLQLAVVKKIRAFVGAGGNLFAMCSATETFDIALAAENTDICTTPFDGDPASPDANSKLDYTKCLAFNKFLVVTDSLSPAHSNIDYGNLPIPDTFDYFVLATAEAKLDPITAMLCQNHVSIIKGFMGQTTAFREDLLKPGVQILASNIPVKPATYLYSEYNSHRAKYIHGDYKKGTWTFYGGHDPEDYRHMVGAAPTDLSRHPNSPGYRLILNNMLLPAAKKSIAPAAHTAPETKEVTPLVSKEDTVAAKTEMATDAENTHLLFSFPPSAPAANNIVLVNAAGAEVFNHTYTTRNVSADISGLQPGIYQVKVNGVNTNKVVKE